MRNSVLRRTDRAQVHVLSCALQLKIYFKKFGAKKGNSCFMFYAPVPPTLVTPVQKILNSSETFSFIFHQGFCGKEHIY